MKKYIALLAVLSAIFWLGAAVPYLDVRVNPAGTAMVQPTAANLRTALEATTVGTNLFKLTNPSAIRFLRINADNTVTALSDSAFATALNLKATPDISVGFNSVNGGEVIVIGKRKGYATCLTTGTITGWHIAVNTGTVTVKAWKVARGVAVPTIANVINTAGVAISSGTYIYSSTVSDFTTTAVTAGDIFAFDITAVSGVTEMSFGLVIVPS